MLTDTVTPERFDTPGKLNPSFRQETTTSARLP
jgi:hypothetical protein